MPQVTFSPKNASKPAPRWFRKLKKGCCMILVPAALTMLQSFGVNGAQATKIQAFLAVGVVALFEFFETMLSNGEEYAKVNEQQNNEP